MPCPKGVAFLLTDRQRTPTSFKEQIYKIHEPEHADKACLGLFLFGTLLG